MKYFAAVTVVALLLVTASTADAATIKATFNGVEKSDGVSYKIGGGTSKNTTAGRFKWTRTGGSWTDDPIYYDAPNKKFFAFCVDLADTVKNGSNYTYNLAASATVFGSAKATDLALLWENAYSESLTWAAADAQAFQAVVWEIVYETASTYDLGSGNFELTGLDTTGGSSSAASKASEWIGKLNNDQWTDFATLVVMYGDAQDQIFEVEGGGDNFVPLPSSALAGIAFLGLLGLVRVRRKRHL